MIADEKPGFLFGSPDEECEKADIVVCANLGMPTPFRDNMLTVCADCGTPIIHRPYVPKKPRKVCINCAVKRVEALKGRQ